eukprot:TRINITY_DN13906_c0_g1_i4.p1 TRINITY_DN13906_c0_g1~~TRINITY_DN13906_c0_g1_i4.p1  ORF type:complete len:392 (-),score=149.35 TRINITY_DN13906_c0_g1_i4:51-1226(-)
MAYYYDANGFWRCDSRGTCGGWWRRRQLHGGNGWRWRSGSDGEWRLLKEKVDELEMVTVKLQNEEKERMKEKEELKKEVDEMKMRMAEVSEAEYRWRWWMEWRLTSCEAVMEEKCKYKHVNEWGGYARKGEDGCAEHAVKSQGKVREYVVNGSGEVGEIMGEDKLDVHAVVIELKGENEKAVMSCGEVGEFTVGDRRAMPAGMSSGEDMSKGKDELNMHAAKCNSEVGEFKGVRIDDVLVLLASAVPKLVEIVKDAVLELTGMQEGKEKKKQRRRKFLRKTNDEKKAVSLKEEPQLSENELMDDDFANEELNEMKGGDSVNEDLKQVESEGMWEERGGDIENKDGADDVKGADNVRVGSIGKEFDMIVQKLQEEMTVLAKQCEAMSAAKVA